MDADEVSKMVRVEEVELTPEFPRHGPIAIVEPEGEKFLNFFEEPIIVNRGHAHHEGIATALREVLEEFLGRPLLRPRRWCGLVLQRLVASCSPQLLQDRLLPAAPAFARIPSRFPLLVPGERRRKLVPGSDGRTNRREDEVS
ncbi:MAG: hypothetical protein NXI35_25205 [bacterium]|nr:hypothetical protein [bacterium]